MREDELIVMIVLTALVAQQKWLCDGLLLRYVPRKTFLLIHTPSGRLLPMLSDSLHLTFPIVRMSHRSDVQPLAYTMHLLNRKGLLFLFLHKMDSYLAQLVR